MKRINPMDAKGIRGSSSKLRWRMRSSKTKPTNSLGPQAGELWQNKASSFLTDHFAQSGRFYSSNQKVYKSYQAAS